MTLKYNHILVAVDGSKEAEAALKKAVGIAERNDATLYLANIIDLSFGSVEAYSQEYAKKAKVKAEELLGGYKAAATKAGVNKVQLIIESGSPKEMIPTTLVKQYNIDLIICGATGLSSAERIFLGSVSERIVRAAKCDVLVVRPNEAVTG